MKSSVSCKSVLGHSCVLHDVHEYLSYTVHIEKKNLNFFYLSICEDVFIVHWRWRNDCLLRTVLCLTIFNLMGNVGLLFFFLIKTMKLLNE